MDSMLDVFTDDIVTNCLSGSVFHLCFKAILVFLIGLLVYTFIVGPFFGFLFFYAASLSARFYKWYHGIEVYDDHDVWIHGWKLVARGVDFIGKIWHGYEVIGLENIPKTSGVALIIYHSTVPLDFCYLTARIVLKTDRMARMLVHRVMFQLPGLAIGLKSLGIFTGPYEKYVQLLKDGNIVLLAPGGALETFWSDNTYKLIWGNRTGFARGAMEAKVPIIPVFAQNSKEAFRLKELPRGWSRYIYDKFRIFVGTLYGGLPVKMRIYVGEQIQYDENISAEDLAKKVSANLEDLIANHQRRPGNTMMALMDRFCSFKKKLA